MPGRIPASWDRGPSSADLRARDARVRANERFLEHARAIHDIDLDGHLIVQRTRQEHDEQHYYQRCVHDVTDHYLEEGS